MSIIERASKKLSSPGAPSLPEREAAHSRFDGAVEARPAGLDRPPRATAPERPAGRVGRPGAGRQSQTVALNFRQLQQRGFITPEARRSRQAEEFRLIKRRLLKRIDEQAGGRHANVVLVTSSRPKEGKTFTSLNLALSLATDERRSVLLVDGDVLQPRILQTLGLRPSPGLTDLLRSPSSLTLADVLLRCDPLALSVLPAGSPIASASELFASQAMVALVDDMATRYRDRVVIFDSPPLLATSEPAVLARLAGQVVLVVEAGQTSESTVQTALDILEQDDKVSFVLNRCIAGGMFDQFATYYQWSNGKAPDPPAGRAGQE